MIPPSTAALPDDLDRVLRATRERFVASFPAQCDAIAVLVEDVSTLGRLGPIVALTDVVHRLGGLAGIIGFPSISAHALELEALALATSSPGAREDPGDFDVCMARHSVEAMRVSFASTVARPAVASTPPPVSAAAGATILLAEDDPDQRSIVMSGLRQARYAPICVAAGDLVVDTARAHRPAAILLDTALPKLDGYTICRLLKADRELASTPVIFLTTGANLDDRLMGLTLGADEFLNKPVDMRELVLRIDRILRCRLVSPRPAAGRAAAQRGLPSAAFLDVMREEITRTSAALAILRVPAERQTEIGVLLGAEMRGRDTIGIFGSTRLLILMPEMTSVGAAGRLEPVIDQLRARGIANVFAGISVAEAPDAKLLVTLIAEADEALIDARLPGGKSAVWQGHRRPTAPIADSATVLVAEDDPEVMAVVDAQMRGAGYQTVMAFDGEQTLALLRASTPDVLLLDLILPKLNGFEILAKIHQMPARPRVLVLSARGREEDVTRAFELGADDYMAKPFSPKELMARVARLVH